MKTLSLSIQRTLILGTGLLVGLPLVAQTESDKEETFDLPEFEVSTTQDEGYYVSNTTAGTRIDEEIRNIPMSIQSISREFLDDTGAISLEEAVEYSAGIQNSGTSNVGEAGLDDDRSSNYKIRGMITGNSLRDGSWRFYKVDGTIIERVEVVRGPSSLLYGIGSFNGIINTMTKKPLFKNETRIDARWGNMGFMRGEIDHQGLLGDNGAYRIAYSEMEFGHWIDNQSSHSTVVYGAVRFKLDGGWLIDVSHEYYQDFRRPGHKILEEPNPFLGDENGFVEVPDIRTFSWQSASQGRDNLFNETSLTVTKEFGPSTFRFTYVRSDLEMERYSHGVAIHTGSTIKQQIIPINGAPGGGYVSPRPLVPSELRVSGRSLQAVPSIRDEAVLVDQFRMEWTYAVDTSWGLQRFLVGAHYLPDYETYVRHGLAYDFEEDHMLLFYKNPLDFTPFVLPEFDTNAQLNHRSNFNDDFGAYAVHIGKFMNQRLNTVTGIRYDWSRSTRVQYHHNGEINTAVGDNGRSGGDATDAFTPQFGINYELSDSMSFYLTTAGGLQPLYSPRDGNMNQFGPTKSRGIEAGLKADFFGGKISGTMAFFDTRREGTPYYDRTAFDNDPSSGGYGAHILVDDQARGVDMQWHWRPSRQWDIMVTYAYTETELSNVAEYVVPILEGQNLDKDGNPKAHDRGYLSSDYLEGQPLNDTPEHAATLWIRHSHRDGWLKGLSWAAGARYMGERVYQSRRRYATDASPLATAPEQLVFDLSLKYKVQWEKLKGVEVRFNMKNVLDDQDLIGDRFEMPIRYYTTIKYTF